MKVYGSPWSRFVSYWIMCEMRTFDTTHRNYIRDDRFYDNNTHVNDASHRMSLGIVPGGYAWKRVLEEVRARLVSLGWRDPNLDTIRIRLNQWFVHDKILTDEIRVHSQLPKDAKAALADNPLF